MIRSRQVVIFSKYVVIATIAMVLMLIGVIAQHSEPAAAAGCGVELSEDIYDPNSAKAYYNDTGFYENRCLSTSLAFPNTGLPYAGTTNGDPDSVGYVIPRTAKNGNLSSEALAGVDTKSEFYDKIRFHYLNRVPKNPTKQEDYWAKDGAAFVVYSFIGKNPPADRNLTDEDWAEFKRRLDNPNLKMALDNNHDLHINSGAAYDTKGRLDFFHFTDEFGLRGPALVFTVGGKQVAAIERKCANLLGKFELPAAPPWKTTADSKVGVDHDPNVDSWTAEPGNLVTWRHSITATDASAPSLDFAIGKSGFSGANVWGDGSTANHNKPVGSTSAIAQNTSYLIGDGANYPEYSAYRVLPSDGGRKLCQSISWGPTDYTQVAGDPWGTSAAACVTVPYNYNLKPSVDGLNNGTATVGGTIPTVSPAIDNSLDVSPGKTTNSPDVDWQLLRVEVPPGGSIPGGPLADSSAPCAHYNNGNKNSCEDKGKGKTSFPAGLSSLTQLTDETVRDNTPVGTKICYTLSVKPYSDDAPATDWRHSAPECLTVNKSPKVQAWGGDLRTRAKILTLTSNASVGGVNKKFGSWVEYGVFSAGTNTNLASGSGLNNGNTNTTTADTWNKLTFANVNLSGSNSYGMFTLPSNLPTVASQFIGAAPSGPAQSNLGALSSGTYAVGDFTIDTSDIGPGKSIIIVSSGRVTIKGNITYRGAGGSDTFTKALELPQVVIIADNIDIKNDATQVDAWLITENGGAINTCSDVNLADPLTAKVCEKPLLVNGPVMTSHLHLRRTGGADTVVTAGAPAEVFNLRPDTFMWAYGRASQAGKAQTVYSVELPPRF